MTEEARQILVGTTPVTRVRLSDSSTLNSRILEEFEQAKLAGKTRGTHKFHGRYENTYAALEVVPSLTRVRNTVIAQGIAMGHRPPLRAGFWFNEMAPGACTTLHTHDDDDELVSAVYYIRVPENSGRLRMMAGETTVAVEPEEGLMLLFPPDLPHDVEENTSSGIRLSVAFNVGPDTTKVRWQD